MNSKIKLNSEFGFTKKLYRFVQFFAIKFPIKTGVQISKENYSYKFDETKNILKIDDKEFKFSKDSKALSLLKLIIKKPKSLYYDYALEKIDGGYIEINEKIKDNYYQLCRGIQNKLSKKGILNFLEFDYNQVKINDIYKKN